MSTKVCKACGQDKPINMFVKNKTCKGGIGNICKQCKNEYKKQWELKHIDKLREQRKQYVIKNAVNIREQSKRSYRKYHPFLESITCQACNSIIIRPKYRTQKFCNKKCRAKCKYIRIFADLKKRCTKQRKELYDGYVRYLLKITLGIKPTQEQINFKRKTLKLKRKIDEKRKRFQEVTSGL